MASDKEALEILLEISLEIVEVLVEVLVEPVVVVVLVAVGVVVEISLLFPALELKFQKQPAAILRPWRKTRAAA